MKKIKKLVITGAAGFIGSRLLKNVHNNFYSTNELLVVDHPITYAKINNTKVAPGVEFLDHITFINLLEANEITADIIVHLGACSSTTETSWDYLADNNIKYSQRLWDWCAKNNSRIIYASSASTYGDGSLGFDDTLPINLLKPLNLYAKSKQEFDLWVENRIKINKQEFLPKQSVGIKFFNVFGPGESHKGKMASMVFHGMNQIKKNGCVKLFKSNRSDFVDGGQMRDFIYVQDVIQVICEFINKPKISGLFNLGTGKAESFSTLIETLFHTLNLTPNIEYIPLPIELQDKYQYFTEAKMYKLTNAGIHYLPTPLKTSIKDYVNIVHNA
jgi:ADP-L-glycero-D-manno-heptose 6-epimerase